METDGNTSGASDTILALRKVIISESEPLARRFRALFSLKHVASLNPPSDQSVPAIDAIAAAFTSPSALLKHELAYCLGQTRNSHAVPHLRRVLEDRGEEPICRHEAAEALAALGDRGSLDILHKLKDDETEAEVVRETCDIAIDKLQWEISSERTTEKLKPR
jgi:deoxyhypusine monooxygenase